MNTLSDSYSQFPSLTEKKQLQIIPELVNSDEGIGVLKDFLLENKSQFTNLVVGKIYQTLYQLDNSEVSKFLENYFPTGIVPLESDAKGTDKTPRKIDYLPLQNALVEQNFQQADLITLEKLCELAGQAALARKWVYFSEVDNFPDTDLKTIDRLWLMHSEGKFGYSVQRQIWLSLGCDFNKLWTKINWKNGNNWTRYPHEFIWDLSAPPGHLPTSNQLRGAKVITSLFQHPVWSKKT